MATFRTPLVFFCASMSLLASCILLSATVSATSLSLEYTPTKYASVFESVMGEESDSLVASGRLHQPLTSSVVVEAPLRGRRFAGNSKPDTSPVAQIAARAQKMFGEGRGYYKGLKLKGLDSLPPAAALTADQFRFHSNAVPAAVDWRASKAMTPVMDQGNCDSCWALVSADSMALMWKIRGLHMASGLSQDKVDALTISASAQQIGDCAMGNVCTPGYPELALEYALINGGLVSDSIYPYLGQSQKCNRTAAATIPSVEITGWEQTPAHSVEALKKAVATSPLIVFISANGDFESYSGGIYSGSCSSELNHLVLLVGYGTDAVSGEDFWLIKNSWGTQWGEGGFIRLAIDFHGCGITTLPALYPVYHPVGGGCGDSFPPPCGAGTCHTTQTAEGENRQLCSCPPSHSMHKAPSAQAMCAPVDVCSSAASELCGEGGICHSEGTTGGYSCTCPVGSKQGWRVDNSPLCVPASHADTYRTVSGDSCAAVATKMGITLAVLEARNPFLRCSIMRAIPTNTVLVVSEAEVVGEEGKMKNPRCTQWHFLKQGDLCPSVWLAADLTQPEFLDMNPGLECTPHHLLVGQGVCIHQDPPENSLALPAGNIPYVTVEGDTLASIASQMGPRCGNVSAADICALNSGHLDCARPQTHTLIQIPCVEAKEVGGGWYVGGYDCNNCPRDWDFSEYCGSNFVTYYSICQVTCNWALPPVTGVCGLCASYCTERVGLALPKEAPMWCGSYCDYPDFRSQMTCDILWQTCIKDCTHSALISPYSNYSEANAIFQNLFSQCFFGTIKGFEVAGGCKKTIKKFMGGRH